MAEKMSRAALEDYPGDANFLSVLGAALIRLKRADEAAGFLRAAVDNDPGYAKAHETLGVALIAQGRQEEALQPLRQALMLNPALESAQLTLSQALLALGREPEARQAFDAFVQQKPQGRLLAMAAEHHGDGRLDKAEAIYREILRQDPRNVSALRLLGVLAMKMEQFRDAAVFLRQAVTIAPDFRVAWIDLSRAEADLHELDAAIASAQRAIDLDPGRASGYVALGNALARSSRTQDAVDAYQRGIAIRPEQAAIYLGLGNVLKTIGRQHEAIAAYREGIRLKPDYAELYWSLSNLKTFRFGTGEVQAMEAALAEPGLPDEAAVHFCFALGKAREDAGDYPRAFESYARGNRLRRAQERYDPVHAEEIGQRIRQVFTRDLLEQHAGAGYPGAAPIFIIGLPRSGSTLIEQILASHSSVEATHELPEGGRLIRFIDRRRVGGKLYPESVPDFSPEFFAELGQRYAQQTQRYRSGYPFFVDKMPNNFASVGLLHLVLPNAKFIDARRDPLDSCLSCYKQLFARGQSFTYDLTELGEYYLEYQRMMDHWKEVLPGRVLSVRYEDVVADLETQTRRILEYCGLPWEDACLRFYETDRPIRTASSEQVRRPIYTEAVGFWRNYKIELAPLIEILTPVLKRRA